MMTHLKRLDLRLHCATGQHRVKESKVLEIPLHCNRIQCYTVQACPVLMNAFPFLLLSLCFAGTSFRDWTGGPWRYRRAPDFLHSHLPKWDCPPRSKTLLQHQTWRDGLSKISPPVCVALSICPSNLTMGLYVHLSNANTVEKVGEGKVLDKPKL